MEEVAHCLSFGMTRDSPDDQYEPLLTPKSFDRHDLVIGLASCLIQLSSPETFFEKMPNLPPELHDEYFRYQEHFDLPKLLLETGAAPPDTPLDPIEIVTYRCESLVII